MLPVSKEGALQPASQFIEFEQGNHHIAERQASGHPHSVTFSPDGRYLLAADLGADKIHVYRYQPEQAKPLVVGDSQSYSLFAR